MANRPASRPEIHDVAAAFGLLTRLPVPVERGRAAARGASGAWAYPLVGLGVGAISAAVVAAASALGAEAAATLGLIVAVAVTGALHEDGLSDTVDGVWGGWTPERRLEIMNDSRIGAYGVLALVLSLMLRWSLAVSLVEAGQILVAWIVAGALSRTGMVWVWVALPPARPGGLAAGIGRPRAATAILATIVAMPVLLLLPLSAAICVLGAAASGAAAVGIVARAKIGGQTGDVLGATQQVTECATLLALVATLT